ncbi:MAG: Calx-beta domain-containing protein, partial [Pseudomonadota bacterium]
LSLVEGAMDEAGPVTGRFRVTRTNAGNPTAALTVNIDITGTAQRNVDYNLGSIFAGSPLAVQIPANVNEAEFVLTPRPDNIVEGVEDVQITLQPDPSLYTVGAQTQADFTLADSVTEVNLSVVDSAMDEAGLVPGTYRVTRTNAGNINQAITVNVDVTGTAAINTDYRPISLFAGAPFAVNLGIGETEAIFTFEPRADNVLEETETIVVTLQPNTSTYTVGSQTQADFTLADDPVVVSLTQEDDTLAEQDLETGSFLVTRSNNGDLTRSLLVNLEVDGTATQNVDYRIEDVFGSSPATTTIPANELEARIVLTPIADQPDNEPDESIELRLLESTSYSVGTTAPLTFTLFDLIDFLFADGFELAPVPKSCSLSELSKLVPERFVDQGSSLLDLDTGLSWSRCGLTGRQDPLGSDCLPDNLAAWPALTDGFWLQRFNEGWVGDNEGFSDWRQASEGELKSLPMACGNALVR